MTSFLHLNTKIERRKIDDAEIEQPTTLKVIIGPVCFDIVEVEEFVQTVVIQIAKLLKC